jgi:hypothetical protein
MRRVTSILILLLGTLILSPVSASAWLFSKDDTLVTIDAKRYSAADFKRWWQFWNDEKLPLPDSPDVYIDWLLLAQEGERMELGSDLGFQRMTEVFVKSRALLMLKGDEINSRIVVTDADLQARYERDFLPHWLVERLEFLDEAAALKAWADVSEGAVTVEELIAREPGQGGPVLRRENWLRPRGVDPGWVEIFRAHEVGTLVDPELHKQGVFLYHLKEQKGAEEADLAGLREGIRRELWKEQENTLTMALLHSLREKYEVEVDMDRIDAIDLTAAEDTLSDDVVITTNRQNVTEKQFFAIAHRHLGNRPLAAHSLKNEEDARALKGEIVGGIIAQNVTDWAALDRRYEEKEPFKWEYDFHVRHRLIGALEGRLFTPGAQVTDDEIKEYFEKNIGRYTQPAMAKLYIVDDSQGPVEQVRADVLVGVPFAKALRDRFGRHIAPQEIPVNHIDPVVKAAVDRLAIGETSPLFSSQGSQVLVHLLERTPAVPLPLERVSKTIRTQLEGEKTDQQRRAYLEMLKSRSRIDVRKQQWKAIQKELGGA